MAMDEELLERARAYVPFNHFKDGPLVAELAAALTLAQARIRELEARLSASAEPVAWRWREKGHVAWKCGTYLPVKPHDHWDIEPLYAHPGAPNV